MAVEHTDIHRDLIALSKEGNSASQYKLYKLYAKPMFNIAMRMMNTREEAEDILQDSFVDAFSKLKYFRFDSSFGSWLKRIVINNCINELKRKKTELQFFDDMNIFDQVEDEQDGYYKEWLSVENIRKAMDHLPSGARMIFSLYLIEGYDHVEISQILKISKSNSKSQYMRARNKIKEILSSKKDETG